jgi:hypothetical protein
MAVRSLIEDVKMCRGTVRAEITTDVESVKQFFITVLERFGADEQQASKGFPRRTIRSLWISLLMKQE